MVWRYDPHKQIMSLLGKKRFIMVNLLLYFCINIYMYEYFAYISVCSPHAYLISMEAGTGARMVMRHHLGAGNRTQVMWLRCSSPLSYLNSLVEKHSWLHFLVCSCPSVFWMWWHSMRALEIIQPQHYLPWLLSPWRKIDSDLSLCTY